MQPPLKAILVGIATAGQAMGYSVTLILLASFPPSFHLYLVTDLASSAPKTTEMVFARAGAPHQEIPAPLGDVVPISGPIQILSARGFPTQSPFKPSSQARETFVACGLDVTGN